MEFLRQMKERGWYIFPDVIEHNLVQRLLVDLEDAYENCRRIQIKNHVNNSEGTAHHLIGQAHSFIECLGEFNKLDSYLSQYFHGKYILNSFGGNILERGMSYANDIHRDIRSFSGDQPLMLNTLLMLDDFTNANGATWLMNGGHRHEKVPLEREFLKHAFQITGGAGTLVIWNSNLWHRAGENKTDKPRRSLTPEFTRPFMKQGFDYTQFVKDDVSEYIRQMLGWNSRTPKTLHEWYQRVDDRFYKGDQG